MQNQMDNFNTVTVTLDSKNQKIRLMSVEKILEPLVLAVTTLMNTVSPSKKKKIITLKEAHVVMAAVKDATEQIVYQNPDMEQEMLSGVEELRETGDTMKLAACQFADDPCSSFKKKNMVRAAHNLLSAVTRLLIIADKVDVHLLLKMGEELKGPQGVFCNTKTFGRNVTELMNQAGKRQMELKDPQLRNDLAAARAILKEHSTVLLTASMVYFHCPELAAAKKNRELLMKQICSAVQSISDVAQERTPGMSGLIYMEGLRNLNAALDETENRVLEDTNKCVQGDADISDVAQERTPGMSGLYHMEGLEKLNAVLDDFDTKQETENRVQEDTNKCVQGDADILDRTAAPSEADQTG